MIHVIMNVNKKSPLECIIRGFSEFQFPRQAGSFLELPKCRILGRITRFVGISIPLRFTCFKRLIFLKIQISTMFFSKENLEAKGDFLTSFLDRRRQQTDVTNLIL